MTTNANKTSKKRTPTERQQNKQRVAEDKARAARWASRRRSQRNQELPIAATALEVPVPVVLSLENSVLQDLLAKKEEFLQKFKEPDTAIAVIDKAYAH